MTSVAGRHGALKYHVKLLGMMLKNIKNLLCLTKGQILPYLAALVF